MLPETRTRPSTALTARQAPASPPQARQLDWYHDDKHTYAEYLAEMHKLSDKYGVPFIDMNNPPAITNADFVDGDHLSDPGAELFSKYFADEIAKYVP